VVIGILEARGRMPGAQSLKDKRRVVKSARMRIRSRFNLSVAEVADQDHCQFVTLAVVGVGSDKRVVEQELASALRLLEETDGLDLFETEISFV
jgi:uncharacterized protein YlxP (DUF503 family)